MIFTERTIKVSNGTATIDAPVILYRGDRKIEIKFTIVDAKFKFSEGSNMIHSMNASYAQLAIINPNGSNAFTEISKTEDGVVVLEITEEMIDQLEEVGFFSFHIRLYDNTKESRISLPPIERGIEVKEPITSEDEVTRVVNTVGDATVGDSVVEASEEPVGDTFDENGNYNLTTWRTGDKITEAKLNKIEEALDVINEKEVGDIDFTTVELIIESNNIFKTSAVYADGAMVDTNGTIVTAADWGYSILPVKPETVYSVYFPSNVYHGNRGGLRFNDSFDSMISVARYIDMPTFSANDGRVYITVTTPANCAYMLFTIKSPSDRTGPFGNKDDREGTIVVEGTSLEVTNASSEKYIDSIQGVKVLNPNELYKYVNGAEGGVTNHVQSPLEGKKWVVIGDSLTESNSRTSKNYHDYVADETGCKVINMGLSGSGYKRKDDTNNAFYQRVLNVPLDADIITIFGSGNDLSSGAALGTVTDTGTDTLCGCMHKTIQNLFSVIPGARLGIILPTPWIHHPPSNKDGDMAKYCEALKEIAGQYSIPVLDLYHGSNLRPWDETFRSLYYKKDEGNGVHPDEDGHALIANKFKMFIQSL